MLNLVIFGPPGAGKGTQAAKIIEKYNLVHLSTGDILRIEKAKGTPLGMEAKEYADKGILVPDDLVIRIIANKLDENKNAVGFIFDGFPRTIAQAEALDKMLIERNIPIKAMLALEVDDDELQKRILLRGKESGRAYDANPEIVRKRIDEYNLKTSPLKKYYTEKGKAHSVYGIGEIDEIFKELCGVIEQCN